MNHSDVLVMESASPSSTCATGHRIVQMATTKILDFAQQVSMDFVTSCVCDKRYQIMSHCTPLILIYFFLAYVHYSFLLYKRGLSLKYFSHFLALFLATVFIRSFWHLKNVIDKNSWN